LGPGGARRGVLRRADDPTSIPLRRLTAPAAEAGRDRGLIGLPREPGPAHGPGTSRPLRERPDRTAPRVIGGLARARGLHAPTRSPAAARRLPLSARLQPRSLDRAREERRGGGVTPRNHHSQR